MVLRSGDQQQPKSECNNGNGSFVVQKHHQEQQQQLPSSSSATSMTSALSLSPTNGKSRLLSESISDMQPITTNFSESRQEFMFQFAVVVLSLDSVDRHIYAMSKPGTMCHVTSVVVLDDGGTDKTNDNKIQEWLVKNNLEERSKVVWGPEGLRQVLDDPSIDAMYVTVPASERGEYVLNALEAGKHVLLRDPLSTSLPEFSKQLEYSEKYKKFVQFTTMFVHQHRVHIFMDRVLREESFGRIHSIDAKLDLNYNDLGKVGVRLPIGPDQNCIRILGRFCVLVSVLMFARVGSSATSVQVHHVERNENGDIIDAECSVNFTKGRILHFDVGYTTGQSRQNIEAKTKTRIATMTDFVIENRDGWASYRVYEKELRPSGKVEIVSGEAIDVTGGPSQDVMMWRTFVEMSVMVDKDNHTDSRQLANVALQTKKILMKLQQSADNGCQEVQL